MRTRLLPATAEALQEAAVALREGKLVAFPTDTVYGLGAHAFIPAAVARIFRVKGREESKALPLLLACAQDLPLVVAKVPEEAWRLAEAFWPGGLTLLLRAGPRVSEAVRAGGSTVGVRVPGHSLTRELIAAVGAPLTGTSANRSGWPSPLTAGEALRQLGGRIPLIIEGSCPGGLASTVLDLTADPPAVRRVGAVPVARIEAVLRRPIVVEK